MGEDDDDDSGEEGRRGNPLPARSLLLSNSTKGAARLNVPIRRTNHYHWNSLPASIRDCRNKMEFKRKLTRHLNKKRSWKERVKKIIMLKLIRKRTRNWLGRFAKKKLPTEGCTGRNGEREKSSGQKMMSDDKATLRYMTLMRRMSGTEKILSAPGYEPGVSALRADAIFTKPHRIPIPMSDRIHDMRKIIT
ncbi:hypothetical protein ANN_12512 [Periplaneta americana]|uniref:Uncharacterized protein n=1 Tax=Periplaneta americana TaxID=6978 RepID=A0ABQ8THE3_PERAM|nr:hypothetical protein ANN_12512 [Periplaneta americana]